MAVAGVPPEAVAMAFDEGDREVIQEMVMKDYWKMVRSLLRKAPVFQRKMDFLASFLEKPVEEVFDAIATAHFAQITVAYTQPNHNLLRQWINELYKYANDQLDGAETDEQAWWREHNAYMLENHDLMAEVERGRRQDPVPVAGQVWHGEEPIQVQDGEGRPRSVYPGERIPARARW